MSALFSLPCVGSADGWRIWTSQKFRRRFVKLCGSRQAVWQHIYTLWTAPFEENHGSRQAVWQPASCVAAKIHCGQPLLGRTTDVVKLCGSRQAVWQQIYIVERSFGGELRMKSSCMAAGMLCGSRNILRTFPFKEDH